MNFSKGTNPTINTDVLEVLIYSLIKFGQSKERSTVSNPQNYNYITSSTSDDSSILSASITFPVASITYGTTGQVVIASTDYLAGVTYSSGNGTFKSTNWVSALIEATTYMYMQQQLVAKNPQSIQAVSYNLQTSTEGVTFSATYSLPIEQVMDANGGWVTTATEWLAD